MKNRILFLSIAIMFVGFSLSAQKTDLVQFSGMVLDGSTSQLFPVPYTNILIEKKGRGTYSDFDGFFSIVVEKGDVVIFSALGYKTVEYTIPEDLDDDRYSLVQLMTKDTVNLPETVVFPWPSKDHFKLEFLAMDVTHELQAKATENIANETLERMRNSVVSDGVENTSFYLRQQARKTYYVGQTPPMNIFNPVAWKDFFEAWNRGDFKKKKNN
jgi:hypothetical protein